MVEVGGSGFGTLCGVHRVAFHNLGTMELRMVDGGAKQCGCHAAAAVADGNHKTGHGPNRTRGAGRGGVGSGWFGIRPDGWVRLPEDPGTKNPGIALTWLHCTPAHRLAATVGEDAGGGGPGVELVLKLFFPACRTQCGVLRTE